MSLLSDALKKLEGGQRGKPPGHPLPGQPAEAGRNRFRRTWIVLGACLLVIAMAVVFAYSRFSKKTTMQAKDVRVAVAVEGSEDSGKGEAFRQHGTVETKATAVPLSPVSMKEPPKEKGATVRHGEKRTGPALTKDREAKEGGGTPLKRKSAAGGTLESEEVPSSPSAEEKTDSSFAGQVREEGRKREMGVPSPRDEGRVVKKEVPPLEDEKKFFIAKSGGEGTGERELRFFNEGVRNLAEGDLSRANRNFIFALEYNPENVDALCNLSVVSIRLGDYDSAYLYLKEALRISPTHVKSLINAGVLNLTTGRYGEALDAFKKALIYDDANTDVMVNLALLYHRVGDAEKALHYGRRAASLSPENPEAWYSLGLIYYRKNSLYQAENAFTRFLALTGESDPRVASVEKVLEAIR